MNYYDPDEFEGLEPVDELTPESEFNPRAVPCPICGTDDALTIDEINAGYVCPACMAETYE